MMLKFNSKILKGIIQMTTQDSHKSLSDHNSLKDSRSMNPKGKTFQVSRKPPRKNN